MTMKPKVSIIMSTYNRAHMIGDAIRSALAQTFTDFELIVVDDGSTDNTREIVNGFGDSRVRYIHKQNAGLPAGRNTAIAHARGEYVAFLDDDDLSLPHQLAVQTAFIDEHPGCDWVSTGYRLVDWQGKLLMEATGWNDYPQLNTKTWLFSCPTCPSAVMVRREWLERVGGFDPLQKLSEDWDLWLRLAHAGCQMDWVREVACIYRIHRTNMTRSSRAIYGEFGTFRMLDKFFGQPDLTQDLLRLKDPAYAHLLLTSAAASFEDEDYDLAITSIQRGLELDPSLAEHQAQRALNILMWYAGSPRVARPMMYARRMLSHLPDAIFDIESRKRQLLGEIAAGTFFRAAQRQDWSEVRRAFVSLVRYDPLWLRNRGVWSILSQALPGGSVLHQLWRARPSRKQNQG